MSRWFRFYDDAINDPTVQRLPGDKFKLWINLLCIASKHDGMLPLLTDLSFLLRVGEDRVAALLDEFADKGLLDPVDGEPMTYAPHRWKERQFADGTAADRAKRYRGRKRDGHGDVTRDDRDAIGGVTALEQNREEKNRRGAVTRDGPGYYAKADSAQLEAWDQHNRKLSGKGLPRDRYGGWRVASEWPAGHGAEIVPVTAGRRP
jgi:hypothetical protein